MFFEYFFIFGWANETNCCVTVFLRWVNDWVLFHFWSSYHKLMIWCLKLFTFFDSYCCCISVHKHDFLYFYIFIINKNFWKHKFVNDFYYSWYSHWMTPTSCRESKHKQRNRFISHREREKPLKIACFFPKLRTCLIFNIKKFNSCVEECFSSILYECNLSAVLLIVFVLFKKFHNISNEF